jgi:hypothetical protein
MIKNFKVSELCNILGVSSQYFYKIINKPIEGVVYNKENINYSELKKFILNKFEDIDSLLSELDIESLDDINIIKGVKSSINDTNKINIEDLKIDNKYIIKSYHYAKQYILREITNSDLYIFENIKIDKCDRYRCLSKEELSEDRFTILSLEEE